MRKLKIDWGELEMAFDSGSFEMSYYLDLETGKVPLVSDEDRDYLDEPDDDLQDWQKQAAEQAKAIDEGDGTRYVHVPRRSSHESYRDMERFIATVPSPRLRDRLDRAIEGRGAFRSFRGVLAEHPQEETRWYALKQRRLQQRILDWLESIDVEPSNPHAPVEIPKSEPPASGDSLLEELTLLVLYLASWEEKLPAGDTVRRAWKGHVFKVLDRLQERGWIHQSRKAKSLYLTDEGVALATELEERYSGV